MTTMRLRVQAIAIATLAVLTFTACDSNEAPVAAGDFDVEAINAQADAESVYDDIDDMSTATFEDVFANSRHGHDDRLDCAEVTVDSATNTVTIDFGEGCTDPRGRVRSGAIVITQNGRRFEPGSVMTLTFEDYSVDGVLVEGTRTLSNIATSTDDAPSFQITLEGGRLTWEDGSVATRESSRIKTWYRAANPTDDEWHIEGSVSGTDRDGVAYSSMTTEPLVFARDCSSHRFKVPVSGVKEYTKGEESYTIDFGDGECDRLATVTTGGVSTEITLRRLFDRD